MGVFDLFKQDDPDSVHRRDADCRIEDLRSDNPIIRQEAADRLQAGGRRVLLPLLERVRIADEPLKVQIVCVLLNLPGVTPSEIFSGLRTTCSMENSEIIRLFSLPGRNAIPGLLKYMTDNDSAVRSSAAGALARIGEPALPLLNKALTHRSHRIRSGAADALTRMNRVPKKFDDYCHFLIAQERWSELIRAKKTAIPFLIGILPDRYYRIRMDAAKALGAIGDPQAVQALGNLLADNENEVCISAIEALGKIQHKTAIPHLVSALSHASYNVRHMAATTLSAYGWSPDTTEDRALFYLASEQWNDLARMGRPAVPFLIQALENPRCGLQEGVAAALKGMGKPGRDALVAASSHESPVIRKAAEKILNEGHTSKRVSTGPAYREISKEVVSPRYIQGFTPAVTTRPESGSISTPGKAEKFLQVPKRQGTVGQHRRSEPSAQEKPPGQVPVPKRSLPECLKSRVPEIPDPYPGVEEAPNEREPDFSGCVREEMPDSDTTDEEILSLIGSLSSTDENIRAIAVDSLGRIGVRAIGALAGALGDQSWEVRLAAAEALGRIENEQAMHPLIHALHDKDAEVRAAATRSLGKIGDFSAFAPLARLLEDPDSLVRRNAESALVAFGNQVAAPIKKLLVSPNPLIRGSAATILGATGGADALLDLVSLFDDPDESVRERAAVALGTIGPRAIPQLAEVFAGKDPKRRLCAVIGFGHAGPEAEEYLLAACRDRYPAVRERARAFLNAGHAGTKSPDTSYQVIDGLYPDITETIPSRPGISNDEGIPVMHIPIPENAGNTLTDTMSNQSPDNNRKTRADATGLPEPAAHLIGPLIDALASPLPQTRILAVQSLGRIGDPQAVLPLVSLLGEKDPVMRQIAAEALGQIGDTGAIPDLIRLLEDPFEQVRKSAARALGKIGHDDTVPGLIGALTDDDYSVRAEAGDILVRMGNTATPHLILALTHPSRKIRRETAFCLDQLGWVPVEIPDKVHYLIAKEAWLELSGMEEAALSPLRRLVLASAEEDLRIGAILVLVKMENISAIGLLIQALRDKSFLIRHKAMNALVDKGESAISPLMDAANSDDEHIRTASEQILERINRKCSA